MGLNKLSLNFLSHTIPGTFLRAGRYCMEMTRLTRDGAELISRDQIFRRERGQNIYIYIYIPIQPTTSRISNLITRLILKVATICMCDGTTYKSEMASDEC